MFSKMKNLKNESMLSKKCLLIRIDNYNLSSDEHASTIIISFILNYNLYNQPYTAQLFQSEREAVAW